MAGLHMGSPTSSLAASGQYRNGKFLVIRRDGTIPAWPYFVLGARDEAAAVALRAYAEKAGEMGMDPQYVSDVRALADQFDAYRVANGRGDPDASLHRKDDPNVVLAMLTGKVYPEEA